MTKMVWIAIVIIAGIIIGGVVFMKPSAEVEAAEINNGYRETGKDLNQFDSNIDDDGIIFFEQEFKF